MTEGFELDARLEAFCPADPVDAQVFRETVADVRIDLLANGPIGGETVGFILHALRVRHSLAALLEQARQPAPQGGGQVPATSRLERRRGTLTLFGGPHGVGRLG